MKIRVSNKSGEQGNLILCSLLIAGIAGVTLASYLVMTQVQSVSIYRSQTWNSSMAVTEAGIEDGLQLINRFAGSMEPTDIFRWTNTAVGDNWSVVSPNVYYVRRYLTNANTSSTSVCYYDVWITNLNNTPTVYSTGVVPWNYQLASGVQPTMATLSDTTPSSTALLRNVYVQTRWFPLFVVAMAAQDRIDMNGNDIITDSFDSADPNFSENGLYPSNNIAKTKAHGDVATNSRLDDSLHVGNAKIKGSVRTGDGTNTIYIGSNGSVGDRPYVEGGSKGIEEGHSSTDFNVVFDPAKAPRDVASYVHWTPQTTNIDGATYQYVVTTASNIKIDNLTGTGGIYVNAPSNDIVNVFITGNVDLKGNDLIRIVNTGAKLRIYMAGSSFNLSGGAWIDNESGVANNFYLFGLQSCTQVGFGGNGNFYGGIYAPNADFTLGGGGADEWDFVGGSVTRTVTMTGHFKFHFDENLAKVGPSKGYIPIAWQEL